MNGLFFVLLLEVSSRLLGTVSVRSQPSWSNRVWLRYNVRTDAHRIGYELEHKWKKKAELNPRGEYASRLWTSAHNVPFSI